MPKVRNKARLRINTRGKRRRDWARWMIFGILIGQLSHIPWNKGCEYQFYLGKT